MPKKKRLYITTSDISQVENISPGRASVIMSDIKVYFKKVGRRSRITFEEYAEYRIQDVDHIKSFLGYE